MAFSLCLFLFKFLKQTSFLYFQKNKQTNKHCFDYVLSNLFWYKTKVDFKPKEQNAEL